jgi:hypothetical protein
MANGSYTSTTSTATGGTNATTTVPVDLFLQALQALTNNAQLDQEQKPIPARFLAIRNAHGDFEQDVQNAFFNSPVLTKDPAGTASLLAFGELPTGSAKLRLVKEDGTPVKTLTFSSPPPFTVNLTSDEANHLFMVEAYDSTDTLLGFGIPTRP